MWFRRVRAKASTFERLSFRSQSFLSRLIGSLKSVPAIAIPHCDNVGGCSISDTTHGFTLDARPSKQCYKHRTFGHSRDVFSRVSSRTDASHQTPDQDARAPSGGTTCASRRTLRRGRSRAGQKTVRDSAEHLAMPFSGHCTCVAGRIQVASLSLLLKLLGQFLSVCAFARCRIRLSRQARWVAQHPDRAITSRRSIRTES